MNNPVLSQRRFSTLADAAMAARLADDKTLSVIAQFLLVLAGSALLALSAQISVPFYPVPVTGQTLVVLIIGMAYGSRLGVATLLAYLVEGGMGLPVFANGGAGWVYLAGPTGGYLIGFFVAALILGFLAERGMGRGPISTALAMLVGTTIIYAFGVTHLAGFIGYKKSIAAGLLPFPHTCLRPAERRGRQGSCGRAAQVARDRDRQPENFRARWLRVQPPR